MLHFNASKCVYLLFGCSSDTHDLHWCFRDVSGTLKNFACSWRDGWSAAFEAVWIKRGISLGTLGMVKGVILTERSTWLLSSGNSKPHSIRTKSSQFFNDSCLFPCKFPVDIIILIILIWCSDRILSYLNIKNLLDETFKYIKSLILSFYVWKLYFFKFGCSIEVFFDLCEHGFVWY